MAAVEDRIGRLLAENIEVDGKPLPEDLLRAVRPNGDEGNQLDNEIEETMREIRKLSEEQELTGLQPEL